MNSVSAPQSFSKAENKEKEVMSILESLKPYSAQEYSLHKIVGGASESFFEQLANLFAKQMPIYYDICFCKDPRKPEILDFDNANSCGPNHVLRIWASSLDDRISLTKPANKLFF